MGAKLTFFRRFSPFFMEIPDKQPFYPVQGIYWDFQKIILTFAPYVLKSADTKLYRCKI
jgi:hypothetical protein